MFNFFKNLFKSKYPQRNSGGFLRRRKAMQCVYAGPDQMNRFKRVGRMEKVYAGPPREVEEDQSMNGVYMGPPEDNEPVMEAVYMGPPDEDPALYKAEETPSQEDPSISEDDQKVMKVVYMGPPMNKA